MTPYYQDKWVTIYHGDSREANLENISAVVTDPPYELGFMGKSWDSAGVSFQKETWETIRKMCLSGSPLMAFGGTRTFHRIACAIEDAGWEIRDTLMWVYGSGFPKSLDIGKAVDKVLGNERERLGTKYDLLGHGRKAKGQLYHTDRDRQWLDNEEADAHFVSKGNTVWEGYGTALKPAYEPIILGMSPLDGTFANNALKHGVAGLNIDECRIGIADEQIPRLNKPYIRKGDNNFGGGKDRRQGTVTGFESRGRFPANFILGYPEEEYRLRDDVTLEQRKQVMEWLDENA